MRIVKSCRSWKLYSMKKIEDHFANKSRIPFLTNRGSLSSCVRRGSFHRIPSIRESFSCPDEYPFSIFLPASPTLAEHWIHISDYFCYFYTESIYIPIHPPPGKTRVALPFPADEDEGVRPLLSLTNGPWLVVVLEFYATCLFYTLPFERLGASHRLQT